MPRLLLLALLALAGCSAAEDAKPNPGLQPPAVTPGRGEAGGVPARPGR